MNASSSDSKVDKWWHNDVSRTGECKPFPGNMVLFIGAGISNDPPTRLPLGGELTNALMEILFHEYIKVKIEDVYKRISSALGKNIPRLEHILSVACSKYHKVKAGDANPRDMLKLFAVKTPNRNHYIIAKHLTEKPGWVITTNFDECIEIAYNHLTGEQLPVYVFDGINNSLLRNLNGSLDDNWGLVKLHGTIGRDDCPLAATLSDLTPGLALPLRELLNTIFDSADLVVVAGYSGTDYLDVNDWIRSRQNHPIRPRLIWIKHSQDRNSNLSNLCKLDSDDGGKNDSIPDLSAENIQSDASEKSKSVHHGTSLDLKMEPFITWSSSFSNMCNFYGETSVYLERLLHQTYSCEPMESVIESYALKPSLLSLYTPTDSQKHLNGALFCLSIGLGQIARDEMSIYNHCKPVKDQIHSLNSSILEKMGQYPEARKSLARPNRDEDFAFFLDSVRLLRKERCPVKALIQVVVSIFSNSYSNASVDDRREMRIEAIESYFDIVETCQSFGLFRLKPFRWFFDKLALKFWPVNPDYKIQDVSVVVEGRLQILYLRKEVLFDDDYNQICDTIYNQSSPPQLWLKSGPLVPGYFLVGLSSCKDEDRLADFVELNLSFVRILLSAVRRKWPRHVSSDNRTDYHDWQFYIGVIWHFIDNADEVALALNEPHLRVALADTILLADRAFHGLAYSRRESITLFDCVPLPKPRWLVSR